MANPMKWQRPKTTPDQFHQDEVSLSNRNSGTPLESLSLDVTPIGMHYLLIHFDIPIITPTDYRLTLDGAFSNPMTLTLDDITKKRPIVTRTVTMECAGNGRMGMSPRPFSMPWGSGGVGTSEWTGTPLATLLEEAMPSLDTIEIAFHGADFGFDYGHGHYYGRALTLNQIKTLDVMLVWAMNGSPLTPQHGAPLRLIVPGWYGMASVKWLTRITALTKPYDGFQQIKTYRYKQSRDEIGEPVTEMAVRSLLIPPGVPDWITRIRRISFSSSSPDDPAAKEEGGGVRPVTIIGRAWSGGGRKITLVEFDGGDGQWQEATLLVSCPASSSDDDNDHDPLYTWTKWKIVWHVKEQGEYTLRCRATDESGETQPLNAPWNVGGFGNNSVQKVKVVVVVEG